MLIASKRPQRSETAKESDSPEINWNECCKESTKFWILSISLDSNAHFEVKRCAKVTELSGNNCGNWKSSNEW